MTRRNTEPENRAITEAANFTTAQYRMACKIRALMEASSWLNEVGGSSDLAMTAESDIDDELVAALENLSVKLRAQATQLRIKHNMLNIK